MSRTPVIDLDLSTHAFEQQSCVGRKILKPNKQEIKRLCRESYILHLDPEDCETPIVAFGYSSLSCITYEMTNTTSCPQRTKLPGSLSRG